MNIRMREAEAADAEVLAKLLTELGYPTEAAPIPERLARLHAAGGAIALVAEHEGEVVGLVTAHAFSSIHADGDMGRLTALVVSSDVRHQGVGRRLVEAAESWLQAQGCVRSSVVTGRRRGEAHEFYKKMGYNQTGLHFTRPWTR